MVSYEGTAAAGLWMVWGLSPLPFLSDASNKHFSLDKGGERGKLTALCAANGNTNDFVLDRPVWDQSRRWALTEHSQSSLTNLCGDHMEHDKEQH